MKLSNGLALNGHPAGRHYLQIPGPTNVPDRILRAMDYPTIDHRGPEFQALGEAVLGGIRRIFRTQSPVVIYPASGTGAWEAALVNALSPGDSVLMCETGHFATLWKRMAERLGLVVDFVPGDWRHAADPTTIEGMLAADTARRYRAVCVVHNETATGVTSDIAAKKCMSAPPSARHARPCASACIRTAPQAATSHAGPRRSRRIPATSRPLATRYSRIAMRTGIIREVSHSAPST